MKRFFTIKNKRLLTIQISFKTSIAGWTTDEMAKKKFCSENIFLFIAVQSLQCGANGPCGSRFARRDNLLISSVN